jgi:hypothetical protein
LKIIWIWRTKVWNWKMITSFIFLDWFNWHHHRHWHECWPMGSIFNMNLRVCLLVEVSPFYLEWKHDTLQCSNWPKHSPCFCLCDEYFGFDISNNIIGLWFCILKFYYNISKCMTLMCSIALTKIIVLVWNLNIWGKTSSSCVYTCY